MNTFEKIQGMELHFTANPLPDRRQPKSMSLINDKRRKEEEGVEHAAFVWSSHPPKHKNVSLKKKLHSLHTRIASIAASQISGWLLSPAESRVKEDDLKCCYQCLEGEWVNAKQHA